MYILYCIMKRYWWKIHTITKLLCVIAIYYRQVITGDDDRKTRPTSHTFCSDLGLNSIWSALCTNCKSFRVASGYNIWMGIYYPLHCNIRFNVLYCQVCVSFQYIVKICVFLIRAPEILNTKKTHLRLVVCRIIATV